MCPINCKLQSIKDKTSSEGNQVQFLICSNRIRLDSDSLPSAPNWFIPYVLYNCTTPQRECLCISTRCINNNCSTGFTQYMTTTTPGASTSRMYRPRTGATTCVRFNMNYLTLIRNNSDISQVLQGKMLKYDFYPFNYALCLIY